MNEPNNEGLSSIVKTISKLVFGVILLFGLNITAFGHLTPGGGFAGGVIIAIAFVLVLIAHGGKTALKLFPDLAASLTDNFGALLFFVIAALALLYGGSFFQNYLPLGKPLELFSAGVIPFCNLAIALKVGGSLYAILIALAIYGRIVQKSN